MATADDTPFLDFFGLTPKSTQALQRNRRDIEQQQGLIEAGLQADPVQAQSDRAGALPGLIKSSPALSGAFAGAGAGTPEAQGLLTGAASQDPAARVLGAAGLNQIQQTSQMAALAQQQADVQAAGQLNIDQYGGLTPVQHGARVVELGNLNFGLGVIEDLSTLNAELGREVVPGAAKGAYEALRGQALNTLRVQFEAGALQAAELEFFESLLPEFGTFSSLSASQRSAKLRELGRAVGNRRDTLAGITAGQQGMVGQPGEGRSLGQILDGVDFPPGTIPAESEFTSNTLDQITAPFKQAADPEKNPALRGVGNLLDFAAENLPRR